MTDAVHAVLLQYFRYLSAFPVFLVRTLLWAASCRTTCWRNQGSADKARRRETTTSSTDCVPELLRTSGRSSTSAPRTRSGYDSFDFNSILYISCLKSHVGWTWMDQTDRDRWTDDEIDVCCRWWTQWAQDQWVLPSTRQCKPQE